ncbi:MAG: GNAT family N-acetyltransferase, partial [Actinomycetes bacterium]
GYGGRAINLCAGYVRSRPGGHQLLTSWGQGPGSPYPFYISQGFVPTGEVVDGEVVLRLAL